MKILHHIISFSLLLLSSMFHISCNETYHSRLNEISNILPYKPDSVYYLLDTMYVENYNFSYADKMYLELLKATAQNKAFIPFNKNNEFVFQPVLKYFLKQPDLYLRMQACYIMGSIYRDLNCRIAAQEWYNKAISMADTTAGAKHLALLARIYSQSAEVCQFLVSIEQPYDLFSKGAYYALQAKDTLLWLELQKEMAICISKQNYPDSAITKFKELQLLFENKCMYIHSIKNNLQIVLTHMYKNDVDSAKKYIDIFKSESAKFGYDYKNDGSYHTCLASYYGAIGELDSMYPHLLYMASHPNWHYNETGYYGLSQYHEIHENWDSALYYVRKQYDELNKQFQYTITSQLQESKLVYDVEREKERTQQAEIRTLRVLLVTVSIILLLLVIIIVIYLNRRKLQAKLDTVYQDYVEKSSLLDNVYSSMLQMQDAYEQLKSQISNHGSNKEKTEQQQLAESRIEALRNTKIVRRFLELYDIKKRPQQEDWDALFETINTVNPRACEFLLLHKSTMILEDHRMCMLICAGFTPKVMKELLTCTSQKLSVQRKRFLEQYFHTKGSAKDFDLLLQGMNE